MVDSEYFFSLVKYDSPILNRMNSNQQISIFNYLDVFILEKEVVLQL